MRPRGLLASLRAVFRERQVYLRSEGEVQYITLKPAAQVFALCGLMLCLFWFAFASINYLFKDQLLLLKERRMYQARLDYEDRLTEMRQAIDKLNDRLLLDQGSYLDRVEEVKKEYDKLVDRHRALAEFFRKSWTPPRSKPAADPERSGRGDLDSAELLKAAAFNAPQSAPMGMSAPEIGPDRLTMRQRYAVEFRSREEALQPLADMRRMFAEFEDMEVALLDQTVVASKGRIDQVGAILGWLGLDARTVATESSHEPQGVGGPFQAASAADMGSERIAERMNKVAANLTTVEKLKHEVASLPLGLPVHDMKEITSGFGIRKDPFRKVAAMHSGIDFAGSYGASVYATAGGVVEKSGWDGAYGQIVQIRHDNGVSTRYAHLSRVEVQSGQRVEAGALIGRLGNTGRSTGAHLHYETRVLGNAIDPVRFWQAGHALQALSK